MQGANVTFQGPGRRPATGSEGPRRGVQPLRGRRGRRGVREPLRSALRKPLPHLLLRSEASGAPGGPGGRKEAGRRCPLSRRA